jgi:hypothetical protein
MINDPVHHWRDRLLQDRLRSIFGAIVNENDLLAFNRRGANCLDNFFDGTLLIVTRDDDGNLHFIKKPRDALLCHFLTQAPLSKNLILKLLPACIVT